MRLARSLARDVKFLTISEIGLASRVWLVAQKYAFLGAAAVGLSTRKSFRFMGRPYHVSCATDAALLQRVLIDAHEYLRLLGLLGASGLQAVDVGAHNGETALAWSIFLRDPTIHCFEPDTVSYQKALANTGGLDVSVHNIGLSDRPGTARLDVTRGSGGDATFLGDGATAGSVLEVDVAPGDDVLGARTIDLLKIDVEGYELHVLNGLRTALSTCRFLVLEVSLQRRKDHQFHEIASVVAEHRLELIGSSPPHEPPGATPTAIDLYFRATQVP